MSLPGRTRPATLLVVALAGCGGSPDPPLDDPPGPRAIEATLIEGGISANWARVIANSSSSEDFRPPTRTELEELDAFAGQLVAVAVANSGSEVARKIRLALSIVGDPRDAGRVRHAQAYDILQRIYEGGAGEISDLIDLDPRRAGSSLGSSAWRKERWRAPTPNSNRGHVPVAAHRVENVATSSDPRCRMAR